MNVEQHHQQTQANTQILLPGFSLAKEPFVVASEDEASYHEPEDA